MPVGLDVFPHELRARDRWLRYSVRKIPLSVYGGVASSVNPVTWSSFEAARDSREGVGLGFVLNGDGVVCIDVDDCLIGGRLAEWFAPYFSRLPKTYVEVSPSGNGLHIWGTGFFDRSGFVAAVDGGKFEIYRSARYLTVTGKPFTSARCLGSLSGFISSFV